MPNLANRNEVAFSERKIMKGTDKIEGPEMQKCMGCCVLNEMGVLGNDRLLFFFFFQTFFNVLQNDVSLTTNGSVTTHG